MKQQTAEKIVDALITGLQEMGYPCYDISDIGNEIGIIIASQDLEDMSLRDFILGIEHGISLVDGSHK